MTHLSAFSREDLRLNVLRTEGELDDLVSEWSDLHGRSINPVPYTTHNWVSLCWQRHRRDRDSELFIVTGRVRGRLVLIVPLRSRRSVAGLRVVSWIDSKTPFYSDLLVEDSVPGRAAIDAAADLLNADRSILRFRFNYVPEDAAANLLLDKMPVRIRSQRQVSVLVLNDFAGPEDYLRRLPTRLRYDYRHTIRVLGQRGTVEFVQASSTDEIEAAVDWLFTTKSAQLAAKGTSSPWFTAPQTQSLFASACQRERGGDGCTIQLLKAGGAIYAAELMFHSNGLYYLSKTAADRTIGGISPGTCLRISNMMEAIRRGGRSVDFMFGDDEWKSRMRNAQRTVRSPRAPGWLLRHVLPGLS